MNPEAPPSPVRDANEAVADVAYRLSEVVAIYPITPASAMGEWADEWAAQRRPNLWGAVPSVVEMQSEAGAAGALHGALTAGSLGTTFTASQGLLLMLPDMFKIAGELTPAVIHVAARAVATHALSIFGDHSDVMAARTTGWALLASDSPQEAQDLAAAAHACTLRTRVPFLHFFDGFRTSHELRNIRSLPDEILRGLVDERATASFRARRLDPEHPTLRGTAQNPDVFFQAREAANPFYAALPAELEAVLERFAALTGRRYRLFDYAGAPDAEQVLVMMGSGAEVAHEAVDTLVRLGKRVGVLKVRLYRPFDAARLLAALPATVRTVAVLDRTKEPGAHGEPLFLDVATALSEDAHSAAPRFPAPVRTIGGRYGLASKEFTPAMAKAALEEAARPEPRPRFTLGIDDDVTHLSLDPDPGFSTEDPEAFRAVLFGLGADGTVSANKNSIKIIGEESGREVQAYFVYDSKKSGSVTESHLRFGPNPIRSSYLIERAEFVACHQWRQLERGDPLARAADGAVVLLNSPWGAEGTWSRLPRRAQALILERGLKVFAVDAYGIAREAGLGGRVNTVLQACFFALTDVLPRERALEAIRHAVGKSYAKAGAAVVEKNLAALERALAGLEAVRVPDGPAPQAGPPRSLPADAPAFVREVTAPMLAGRGDSLPVSAFPPDGVWPVGTSRYEKRAVATELPVWDEGLCIQCGKCVIVCPHAAIRAKVLHPEGLAGAPPGFKSAAAKWAQFRDRVYTLQVAVDDCTGCRLCVEACPARDRTEPERKSLVMEPAGPRFEAGRRDWEFFGFLPGPDRSELRFDQVKDVQLAEPLFEFSGACAGCGEAPYLALLTRLFGDRMLVANATGCSSIFGGNLPTTPWCSNAEGRGPAWSNSLFEDNAEFGLGMRLAADHQRDQARALVQKLSPRLESGLVKGLLEGEQETDAGISAQRGRVSALKGALKASPSPEATRLLSLADALVRKSVWIVGGDGWAYDIGFGGLDHVLASGADVKILVLDTEVYSNTGGQASKSTPRGAVARFASGGKSRAQKDLALMAMAYGDVYVARVALGASDAQTLTALREAEAYRGPALILAYSPCIAHGFEMGEGLAHAQGAVRSGHWPLMRFDPRLAGQGKPALRLDSRPPDLDFKEYAGKETRYSALEKAAPGAAAALMDQAAEDARRRWALYAGLAGKAVDGKEAP